MCDRLAPCGAEARCKRTCYAFSLGDTETLRRRLHSRLKNTEFMFAQIALHRVESWKKTTHTCARHLGEVAVPDRRLLRILDRYPVVVHVRFGSKRIFIIRLPVRPPLISSTLRREQSTGPRYDAGSLASPISTPLWEDVMRSIEEDINLNQL